jgi:SulP family sulfate permease
VLLFAGLIELVTMPCLAGLLIVAGWQAIVFGEMADVRDAGWMPRLIMVLTVAVTLVLPIRQAVFFGVLLSVLLFTYRAAMQIRVWELISLGDGRLREQPPQEGLSSHSVTLLQFYGTTFFGAAYTLEKILPSPLTAELAVVVLRLGGHEGMASTFVGVLEREAERLRANGGKLLPSGVSEAVWQRLLAAETTKSVPEEDIFLADDMRGSSSHRALAAAEEWIAQNMAKTGAQEELDQEATERD